MNKLTVHETSYVVFYESVSPGRRLVRERNSCDRREECLGAEEVGERHHSCEAREREAEVGTRQASASRRRRLQTTRVEQNETRWREGHVDQS